MATWFPENGPRDRVEGFVSGQREWSKLIGKKIRIRWIDGWGEAFYTGKLGVVSPLERYEDVPDSTEIRLELSGPDGPGVWLTIPDGLEDLDVWTIPEAEDTTGTIPEEVTP